MIEPILVRRLSAISLLLAAAGSSLALVAGSPRVAGGLFSGALLGLLPIISWSWLGAAIMPNPHRAEAGRDLTGRDRSSAKAGGPGLILLMVAKFAVYGIALFLLIARNLVDPLAFAGALLAPSLLMAAMLSARRAGAAR